jgi:predicted enzyme related to lactoylglutathione lyase
MAQVATAVINKPAWVDLSTTDAEAARDFYSKLFGWNLEVSDDPQYGGYATAKLGEQSVAGIGPKQEGDQGPTAWSLYIGTDDVDRLAQKVRDAGGNVLAEPFDVGDQGRMAVFADPSGAVISGWQAAGMSQFTSGVPQSFGWAELNARGLERAIAFYETVFGWTHSEQPFGEGEVYTSLESGGVPIAGALEMSPQLPAETPSYWLVYFTVASPAEVDAGFKKAIELGGRELVAAQDMPGGRFAIVSDPQGASFGILYTEPQ